MSHALEKLFSPIVSSERERAKPNSKKKFDALLLNADYTFVGTINWRDAIRGLSRNILYPVAHYDEVVRSPSTEIQLPSVVAFRKYVDTHRPAALTRWNLFIAYDMRCCYCAEQFPTSELTYEHVIPRSKSGLSEWRNLLPCCAACNQKKGGRTLEEAGMKLAYPIRMPTGHEIALASLRIDYPDPPHPSWMDFISEVYWTTPLKP